MTRYEHDPRDDSPEWFAFLDANTRDCFTIAQQIEAMGGIDEARTAYAASRGWRYNGGK